MKTIIVQRHSHNLIGIQERIAEIDENIDIFYTSNPRDVLRRVRGNDPVFVVSGQVFDYPTSGTNLARAVKSINPYALFFIYSVMPEWNESVDGIIPKEDGTHSLLARILTSNLEDITPVDLGLAFPEVRILAYAPE